MMMPDDAIRRAQELMAETIDINENSLKELMPFMDELCLVNIRDASDKEESTLPDDPHSLAQPTELLPFLNSYFSLNRSYVSESSQKLLQQYAMNAISGAETVRNKTDKSYRYHTAAIYLDILKVANALPPNLESMRALCRSQASQNSTLFQNIIHEHLHSNVCIEDYYTLNGAEELGKGTYGQVVVATHRGSGERYACKILNIARIEPRQIFKLNAEVSAMRTTTGHRNVISLREVFYSSNYVFFIMDICNGGELFNLVTGSSTRCGTEQEIAYMLSDMLSAIAYLHSKKIVHRDIKLENWMLASPGDRSSLKLIDFGLSKYLASEGETMFQAVGSAYYVAPEVLLGNYNESCDVWSMGVIAYMMFSGTPPFWGRNDVEVRAKIIEAKFDMTSNFFVGVSSSALDLIRKLLAKQPEDRLSAAEALKHPFLRSAIYWSIKATPLLLKKSNLLTTLRTFCQFSNLRRAILSIACRIAGGSDPWAGLLESFRAISGPTGVILLSDLDKALKGYASTKEIEGLFKICNAWGDGGITYAEFLAATTWARIQIGDPLLRTIFQLLDTEGKGFLTAKDLQIVAGNNCTTSMAESMIAEADLEGEKIVYFPGFLRFWRNNGNEATKKQKLDFPLLQKLRKKFPSSKNLSPNKELESSNAADIPKHDENS